MGINSPTPWELKYQAYECGCALRHNCPVHSPQTFRQQDMDDFVRDVLLLLDQIGTDANDGTLAASLKVRAMQYMP